MATDTIRLSAVIPAEPERVYRAWLDSAEHSAFTGGSCTIEPWAGGRYSVSDGYIEGSTLELEPSRRIVQTWRSAEFPEGSADSRLEVLLEPTGDGTRITLVHSEIPEGDGDKYREGWEEYYFAPLARYFAGGEGGRGMEIDDEEAPEPEPMTERSEAPALRPVPPAGKKPAKAVKKPAKKVAKKPAKKAVKKAVKKAAKKTAKKAAKKARRPTPKRGKKSAKKAARKTRKTAARRKAARAPARRKAAKKRAAPRRKSTSRSRASASRRGAGKKVAKRAVRRAKRR